MCSIQLEDSCFKVTKDFAKDLPMKVTVSSDARKTIDAASHVENKNNDITRGLQKAQKVPTRQPLLLRLIP